MLLRLPKLLLTAGILLDLFARTAHGIDPRFYAVEAQAEARRSPAALVFSWPPREDARGYTVRRKLAADSSWSSPIASLPGAATGFTDSAIAQGVPYEYEIQMESDAAAPEGGWINAYGYLWAGLDVPERHSRGRAILVVDGSMAGGLAGELEIFRQDLVGAGWSVTQHEVARDANVGAVKALIRGEYLADPAGTRAVILIGHVPVPYSGNIAPDMHASHRGAWPADAFYGDMDGRWTDDSVAVRGEDFAENDNVPGDGKADQSAMPSPIELEVGRIDLWGMTRFAGRSEPDLLRNYFRKDHNFRHRLFTAPRQGLIRDNFGDLDGDAPAVDAWRHFTGFFGAGHAREAGFDGFFSALAGGSYLWAYGCGGGANDKADGVGSTADFAAGDPRAVFLMLHGSYFGDWNYPDNFLRAAIATPGFTLASVWTGLPHWYLHHLALGETIGYSTRVSQNNLSLYKSHRNFSPAEVHIALMGDPTLEMFPVIPPAGLTAAVDGDVRLQWQPSGDDPILGYHVYHATAASGLYRPLTSAPVTATAFSHAAGVGVHYYMVRAVKLETTGSGTFRNLSQGIFASVAKSSGGIGVTPVVTVRTEDAESTEFRANSGSFRFTRDPVDGTALTVRFTLGGTAQSGVDYQPAPDSVTIGPWEASALVAVYPHGDSLTEGDESVTVQLQPGGGYRIGSPDSAQFFIRDVPPAAVNERPTISAIPDQAIDPGTVRDLTFLVGDAETPASSLVVRGESSNPALLPFAGLQFGGGGANRTLRLVPLAGASGTAEVTVSVTDGANAATRSFKVTVPAPILTRPTITSIRPVPGGLRLRFAGPPGREVLIEESFDAENWTEAGTSAIAAGGSGEFLDVQTRDEPVKLYRLEVR